MFDSVYGTYDMLCHEEVCCPACSSMLLGTLSKAMAKMKMLQERVTEPFNGHSVTDTKLGLEASYKTPRWAEEDQETQRSHWEVKKPKLHRCTLQQYIGGTLMEVRGKISSVVMNLKDFQRQPCRNELNKS